MEWSCCEGREEKHETSDSNAGGFMNPEPHDPVIQQLLDNVREFAGKPNTSPRYTNGDKKEWAKSNTKHDRALSARIAESLGV